MSELVVYVGIADPSELKLWADEDNCEYRVAPKPVPVAQLFRRFSFSQSWLPATALAAEEQGIVGAQRGLVLFDGSAPHVAGSRVGSARCLGRFNFDTRAPRVGELDERRQAIANAGLDPEIAEAIDRGLAEAQRGELSDWRTDRRITPSAAGSLGKFTESESREFERRLSLHESTNFFGLRAVTTTTHRAYFTRGALVAMTPCDDMAPDVPADRPRPINGSEPEGRAGVYLLHTIHQPFVLAAEVDQWRATMDDLREEWSPQKGWHYIAVVFDSREEALALQAEKLRKPYVRGWYRHPTGVYEP